MPFWKRRHWDEQFDENYGERPTRERPNWRPQRIWPHLLSMLLLGVLFVGLAGLVGGQPAFERTVISLVQPVGLLWIALMALTYFALLFRNTLPALIAMFAWTLLTVAGNSFLANQLAALREAPFQEIRLEDVEPLDAVFLLGGGSSTRRNGEVQLDESGDRVAVAARLFHAQKVQKIICTGTQSIRTSKQDLHPREEAARLLAGLGVAETAIEQLAGENTSEEAQNLKAFLDANPDMKRIGVVSSAWHLPRVQRLLQSQGIEAIAIPSDFLSGYVKPTPDLLVPSAQNLRTTQLLAKEYLADWLGR